MITAFLTGATAGHVGSFGTASNVLKHASSLLRRSPGLCNRHQLHVVHDSHRYRHNTSIANGVHLHYFEPVASMPPGDARWRMFASVLNGAAVGDWDCAWALDMTDVGVLRIPPCDIDHYGPAGLAIGSDACSNMKPWLRQVAERANWTSDDSAFRAHLRGESQHLHHSHHPHQIFNCGIIGGLRGAFLPAVERMAARMAARYSTHPPPPHVPMDMLFWNEEALRLSRERSQPLVSGYPHGPVNLPMWGGLSDATAACPRHVDPFVVGQLVGGSSVRPACTRSAACRMAWVNATLGHYWFGHKLQAWWWRYNAIHLGRGGWRNSCVR